MAVDFATMFGLTPTEEEKDPLFNVALDFREPRRTASPAELMLGTDPWEELADTLTKIEADRQAAIAAARGKGFLERYPVVETPEQEEAARRELELQGLKQEQINRKINKWKKKGGKVKTSAKLGLAAKILGNFAEGYLAVDQRRAPRTVGVFNQLEAERERRAAPGTDQANRAADQATAVATAKAQAAAQQQANQAKRMIRNQEQADKMLLQFGMNPGDFEDLESKNVAIAGAAKAERDEINALRSARLENQVLMEQRRAATQEEREMRNAVGLAFKVGDSGAVSDESLKMLYSVPPDAQTSDADMLALRNRLDKAIQIDTLRKEMLLDLNAANLANRDVDLERKRAQLDDLQNGVLRQAQADLATATTRLSLLANEDPDGWKQTKGMAGVVMVKSMAGALANADDEERGQIFAMMQAELSRPIYGLTEKEVEDAMRNAMAGWERMVATGTAPVTPDEQTDENDSE